MSKLTGFYPHAPKVFKQKLNADGDYDIVDTRTNKVVETVLHLKDALKTCERKNETLR